MWIHVLLQKKKKVNKFNGNFIKGLVNRPMSPSAWVGCRSLLWPKATWYTSTWGWGICVPHLLRGCDIIHMIILVVTVMISHMIHWLPAATEYSVMHLSYLIFNVTLQSEYFHHSHITNEKTSSRRLSGTLKNGKAHSEGTSAWLKNVLLIICGFWVRNNQFECNLYCTLTASNY